MGHNALIEKHSELADGLLPWMIGLVVVAAACMRGTGGRVAWPRRGGDLTCLGAGGDLGARRPRRLGTSVQVVLIGHSGAKAAWSDVASQSAGK